MSVYSKVAIAVKEDGYREFRRAFEEAGAYPDHTYKDGGIYTLLWEHVRWRTGGWFENIDRFEEVIKKLEAEGISYRYLEATDENATGSRGNAEEFPLAFDISLGLSVHAKEIVREEEENVLYVVLEKICQGDYTEPKYYSSAQDASYIRWISRSRELAEQKARSLQEAFDADYDGETDAYHGFVVERHTEG